MQQKSRKIMNDAIKMFNHKDEQIVFFELFRKPITSSIVKNVKTSNITQNKFCKLYKDENLFIQDSNKLIIIK